MKHGETKHIYIDIRIYYLWHHLSQKGRRVVGRIRLFEVELLVSRSPAGLIDCNTNSDYKA
jgi:hypothetical protein